MGFLQRRSGAIGLVFLLAGCALQFDNPSDEARKKILTPVPVSFSGLIGRWEADSTYTLQDLRATKLSDKNVILEFNPDSSFFARDSSGLAFPGPAFGSFQLFGDSLSIRPALAGAYPALATLRFLGNYLELYLPEKQRYVALHKRKPAGTFDTLAWLDSARWLVVARRSAAPGNVIPEPLRSAFEYRIFRSDSLLWENNARGLTARDTGVFALDSIALGIRITEQVRGSSFAWLAQWLADDSLRLWPLRQGRTDSGFALLARTPRRHAFDLDCAHLPGYWRADSIFRANRWTEMHFGYFFDLGWDASHRVAVTANAADLPRFRSWDIDSGNILLDDGTRMRAFTLDTTTPSRFEIRTVPGTPSAEVLGFRFTTADSAAIQADALARFPASPFLRAAVGADTLRYFWYANWDPSGGSANAFEVFGVFGPDTLSMITQLPAGNQTYSPSVAGFRFGLQGKTTALGQFACFASATAAFALRLSTSADPKLFPGTFQGQCKVRAADNAGALAPDSLLDVSGDFRFRSVVIRPLNSALWSLP